MRDFTLSSYQNLLGSVLSLKYQVFGVQAYLSKKPTTPFVVIRHDVDRRPENSLATAKLENYLGIQSTYYFRITKNSFNEKVIREIDRMGHEIGYHYEDLAIADGDIKKAKSLFEKHLERLRKIAPISTVAMHGRPLSPFDGRDIWKAHSLQEFGLIGEAFLTINYSDFYYFTDTGRTWSNSGVNLRDRVLSLVPDGEVASTSDLINFLQRKFPQKLAIVMHPERWDDSTAAWMTQLAKDRAINTVKRVIQVLRK